MSCSISRHYIKNWETIWIDLLVRFFGFGEQQIRKRGQFLPYGATLLQSGEIGLEAATSGEEFESTIEVLPVLHDGLRARVKEGASQRLRFVNGSSAAFGGRSRLRFIGNAAFELTDARAAFPRTVMIQKRDLIAYAAAAWAFTFGIFHFIWAMGWYVGLNAKEAEKAFAKPLFYAFDLLIAAMCAIAVPIALVFVRPREKRKPHKFVSALAWTGTILLVLRSASIVQTVYLLVTKQFSGELRVVLWEVWFYCGAVLWGLTVWHFALRQGVWKIVAVLLLLFLSLYLFLMLFVRSS